MKRRWSDFELDEHFTLLADELALLASTTDHNRLGFAVLLKCFEYEGRFPPNQSSVSNDLVAYLAKQLNVPPKVFDHYDWGGPSIRQHRARIRQWLGFRPYEEADRPALIEWLRCHVLPKNQNLEFLIETTYQHLRVKRIEPPTRASIERIIRSAIQTYETEVFDSVYKNLPATIRPKLDELLSPNQSQAEQTPTDTLFHQIKTCHVRASTVFYEPPNSLKDFSNSNFHPTFLHQFLRRLSSVFDSGQRSNLLPNCAAIRKKSVMHC
jgi:hypothetical protein